MLRRAAAAAMSAAWEARRRAYASGLWQGTHVSSRVVSVGNLTVGGTGKTTLTLHLAQRAVALGVDARVVCRRYRPGPEGFGDEERLYQDALGPGRVLAGRSKRERSLRAAADGAQLVLVDDGFSHWALLRDLDIVLLDALNPFDGGRLLPAGRLREPMRALQRAQVVVLSRLAPGQDPEPALSQAHRFAPAATLAAGRHALVGFRALDGGRVAAPSRVRVVTATGNPAAVSRTASEAGCEVASASVYRDHHWFTPAEARSELDLADRDRSEIVISAKDAVRWPLSDPRVRVMDVTWQWVCGGEDVERRVFAGLTGTGTAAHAAAVPRTIP
ncbi:MAG: tetraacyldisaccharide 4'-kinase [Candidatus Eisenbacteria bacterium]|nr:tetraacyldisaccharide 4'-kinase [Candidatus Eisenbacteria bacterium]